MKKSLTENIMTSRQSQQRTNARKNKVEFLALKSEISEALEKGWSVTIIWETLRDEGSFTASYNTFRLYVLEYLNGQKSGFTKESVEIGIKNRRIMPPSKNLRHQLLSILSLIGKS